MNRRRHCHNGWYEERGLVIINWIRCERLRYRRRAYNPRLQADREGQRPRLLRSSRQS